jgi:hypothetical protein
MPDGVTSPLAPVIVRSHGHPAGSARYSDPCEVGGVTIPRRATRSGLVRMVIWSGVRGHPRCSQSAATPRARARAEPGIRPQNMEVRPMTDTAPHPGGHLRRPPGTRTLTHRSSP